MLVVDSSGNKRDPHKKNPSECLGCGKVNECFPELYDKVISSS